MAITDWMNRYGIVKNAVRKFIKDKSSLIDLEYYVNPLWNTKLSVKNIQDILDMADSGQPDQQAALYRMIIDRDPIIGAHLQTRLLAVLSCDWEVNNTEDNERNPEIEKELYDRGIHELICHLLSAIINGYSAVATLWEDGGKVKEWRHFNPQMIQFDQVGNPALIRYSGEIQPFIEYPEGQLIFHQNKLLPGLPAQGGLLRCLVWLYLYKNYGLQQKARFLEKFGCPFTIAKLSAADFANEETKKQVMLNLKNLGLAGNAVVPEGTEIITVNPAVQNNAAAFQEWFNYIDDSYALVILGQLATSKESNGFSKGNAQENVRLDILQSDCRAISSTINRQFLKYYEKFNFGTEGELSFNIGYETPEDLNAKAGMVLTLSQAGYRAKKEWVEKSFDIPIEESVQTPAMPQQDTAQLTAFSQRNTDRFLAREEYITRLTNNTLDKLFVNSETQVEMYKPLQQAIREVFKDVNPDDENILEIFSSKIEELFKRYPAIYDDMDTTELQKAIQGACLAAMVKGSL